MKKINLRKVAVVALVLYSLTLSYVHFVNNFTLLPDRGHRYYGVKNQKTAILLAKIFDREAGLGERFTFSPRPSNQMLLKDNTTVLGWLDEPTNLLPPNALSLAVDNPRQSAARTVDTLIKNGYTATILPEIMTGTGGKLIMILTDAFDGSMLVYRLSGMKMGPIPEKRMLTK